MTHLLMVGLMCLLSGPVSLMGPSRGMGLADAAGTTQDLRPGEMPATFMEPSTLSKLQSSMCRSCSPRPRMCRDVSPKDVCYLLCGCSNYYRKCSQDGQCSCPVSHEGECPAGSSAVCDFDDALVCSTAKDACFYYDERKLHCDCRPGWSGQGCHTCDEQLVDCNKADSVPPPSKPSGAGLDFSAKALVVGCSVCVLVGVMLGVLICLCRGKKLACVTVHRTKDNEKQEETKEPPEHPKTRKHFYSVAQYAVPDKPKCPDVEQTASIAAYAEPIASYSDCDSNYYYKLEPTSGIVTYESVSHRGHEEGSGPARSRGAGNPSSSDVKAEGSPMPCRSAGMYDRLQRNVGIVSGDVRDNYSRIELQSA